LARFLRNLLAKSVTKGAVRLKQLLGQFSSSALPLFLLNDLILSAAFA